jgi:sirohydrochlorin ferrochelatase
VSADLDIILAAHGAGDDSGANAFVRSCALQLEAGAAGARVTAAFHLGAPAYSVALRRADRAKVLVVPLLMSDGFFADRLRGEISSGSRSQRTPVVLRPIGTQPRFIRTVANRVAAAMCRRERPSRPAMIIVVAHGTQRHAGSGGAGRTLADAIARRSALPAHAAYLDQSPTIEEVIAHTPAGADLIIVPLLLGGAGHAERDVPSRVAAAAAARGMSDERIAFIEPLSGLTEITDIVSRLVRDARA